MDKSFWDKKWENNEIAFHGNEVNPLLIKYFNKLSLAKGTRIFVPLCGKTLDIHWLLSNGYQVVGAELSKIAIERLFVELGLKPKIEDIGKINHYYAENIDIFVGDIFDVTKAMAGVLDAIYDRAALVAFPEEMRDRYIAHITEITNKAPQFLICYEYNQSMIEGPPFSISSDKINQYYGGVYDLTFVSSENIVGGMKGKCEATEIVWLLKKKK